ncbi:MAG: hypothetical protein GDA50_06550 [Alphaproteobacteria bacterium GM202ARS2]|nr:hypothetical protein [Alphaproteobacteria bacterium GM202ARS2]
MMSSRVLWSVMLMVLCVGCDSTMHEAQPEGASGFRHLHAVTSDDFMVATANPHASEAAAAVLGVECG